ncbi:MAG: hypothetical protein JO313_07745 [Verrucomicrobia bacterium]|nr:hypothetical protein [Verrucomicrobiota bacterium]MBV9643775.1 hypothetical protein [Verrucomicrobiota bacterium]
MDTPPPDLSLRSEESPKSTDLQFQKQLEDWLNEIKADVSERPFLWLIIAFLSGFVSNSFPARMLFLVVVRMISWLLGPAILLMGVVKISDLFFSSRAHER